METSFEGVKALPSDTNLLRKWLPEKFLSQSWLFWAAAHGGVTNGGLRGVWLPFLEIGRNRPFSPFFCLFHPPGKSRKRRKKAFFLGYPRISLNPHLRHSNYFEIFYSLKNPAKGGRFRGITCVQGNYWKISMSDFLVSNNYVLSGPNVLESTRTLAARKPLNFGNSESLTRKLGKSDSETRKTNFWVCVSEFLRRSFWVARFCPKKSGTKTPKMRPTTVNVVFWTFCANAKTARNCPTRKLCLGNSEARTFWVSELEFLSFWVGVSEFVSLGGFDFSGFVKNW